MASEPTLDLQRLTAAISDAAPSGDYLKQSDYDRFQQVKDARTRAVAAERKQRELAMYSEDDLMAIPEEDRQVEPADWRTVRDHCVTILAEHSKDLWVAAWLIEANARLAGFAGLRDGFRLVTQLVESYWEGIHPPPDEDEGYVDTVSQLASLNGEEGPGTLIVPIEEISLVPGHAGLSFAAYRQATEGRGGDYSEGEFLAAARQVDPEDLRDRDEDIAAAIEAFAAMNRALEDRCGTNDGMPVAPPSSQIRQTLEEIQRTFRLITRDVLSGHQAANEHADADTAQTGLAAAGANGAALAQAQVDNREDAFRMLLKAAEFFRKTEPHSPVSYMLQQAVRFGRMDLPDLLKELISDEDVLKRFAERTGVDVGNPESEDDE